MKIDMKKKRKKAHKESSTTPRKWPQEQSETEKSLERAEPGRKKKKRKKVAKAGVDAHMVKNLSKKFTRNIRRIKNDFELGKNRPKLPKVKSKKSFILKNDLNRKKENTTWGSIRNISKQNQNSPQLKNFQSVKQNTVPRNEDIESVMHVDKWEVSHGGAKKDFKGLFTKNTGKPKTKRKKGTRNLTKKPHGTSKAKQLSKRRPAKAASKTGADNVIDATGIKIIRGKKKRKKKKPEIKVQKTTSNLSLSQAQPEPTNNERNSSQRSSKGDARNSLQNTKEVLKKRDAKTVNKKKKPRTSESRSIDRKRKDKEVRTGWEMQRTLKGNEKSKKDTIFCVIKGYRDSYFVNGKELNGINELIDFIKAKKSADT